MTPLLTALLACMLAATLGAQTPGPQGPLRGGMDREYWLVLPDGFDARRTYWLVVLVHGFQGEGRDILWLRRALSEFDDFIVLAPSFPERFQLLGRGTDEQLIDLHAELREKYRLHDRMFVCGFSAGAQFAHRFTMRYPDRVVGCSAHGGGTWGPATDARARAVPMTLSCGLDDLARSSAGQELSRVQAAHRYFAQLAKEGFHVKARLFRGLGHATSAETESLIAECYRLATRGLYSNQAADLAASTAVIRAHVRAGRRDAARAAIAAVQPAAFPELPPKELRRADLGARQRAVRDVVFRVQGLGGLSANGARYWVDDSRENAAGWITNDAARARRARVLAAWLERVRSQLAPRSPR